MATLSAAVSIRDQILPVAAGQSTFDVLAALGVNSVEALVDPLCFVPHLRPKEGTPLSVKDDASIERLREVLQEHDVRISAILIATDFSGDHADSHVNWAVNIIQAAAKLGVPVVRIDTWTSKRELSAAHVKQNLITRVRQILQRTPGAAVDLGLENHGPISNDESFLDDVLAALSDPRVGLTLDTGNFYWYGYPLPDVCRLIEKYAPRAKHTHIKSINYPPAIAAVRREIGHEYKQCCSPLHEGNLDLKRIVAILRAAGYQRDYCIEDESLFKVPDADKLNVLRLDVKALREALA